MDVFELSRMDLADILPIVDDIVKRRCSTRIRPDVVSLAMLRLVEANSRGFNPNNPRGFATTVVHRAIADTLKSESRMRVDGDADLDTIVDYRSTSNDVEINDLFGEISNDEVDRKILQMRSEGRTFCEIQAELRVSRASIGRRLNTIQRTYADISALS